jgi:hypothetical protein
MKRAILLILGALVLLGGLTGCARDERAVKAEQHAKNLIENFAKNQNILQEGERRMYRAEAESHVTTHFKWDVERISNSPIERTAAIAEVSRLADVRVAKLKEVEARVQGMKDAYELTLKDLVGARALYEKLEEYNKASSFNFFGLFGAGSRVEPPAEIVPVDLNPPQPPKFSAPVLE